MKTLLAFALISAFGTLPVQPIKGMCPPPIPGSPDPTCPPPLPNDPNPPCC